MFIKRYCFFSAKDTHCKYIGELLLFLLLLILHFVENGEIDFEEFVQVIRSSPRKELADELREAFQIFDKDNSGAICVDELKQVW